MWFRVAPRNAPLYHNGAIFRILEAIDRPRPLDMISNIGSVVKEPSSSSDDTEEGQLWNEKIASLGTVMMNTISVTTIPDWITANGSLVPLSVYGSSRTQNLRHITPDIAQVLGQNLEKMPSDPACMFTIHQLRGFSANPNMHSVFAAREPHFMLEILGYSTTEENEQACEEWASDFVKQVQATDFSNILPDTYVSLTPAKDMSLVQTFGWYLEEVMALKNKYDPDDVFALSVPRLE